MDGKSTRTANMVINQLALILFSMIYLVPAWMVLINSFKDYKYASQFGIGSSPDMTFGNYVEVFKVINIPRAFLNAIIIQFFTIIIVAVISSMGAFTISRSRTRFSKAAYVLYFTLLIVPGAPVPMYFVLKSLGILNTYIGIIIIFISLCIPFNTFFYTGFVKTIPREMDDAATIDGCGRLRMFFTVIFPLLMPATTTLAVFNFMGIWNDLQTYIYFASPDKWVLPMTVYRFIGQFDIQWNYVFAHMIISVLPILIVYMAGQKYIISGLTAGAVKG